MVMSSQVDGREAQPRVETCPICGEHFDSLESLDAHLPAVVGAARCRDPWTITLPGPSKYTAGSAYAYRRETWSLGFPVWVLNEPKAAS